MGNWQKYVAELYGTFVLVGVGTGAMLTAAVTGGGAIEIAIGFGLGLVAALYTVGKVSGGHFNPAVSLGMFLDKRISATDLLGYWVSQLAGAALASLALAFIVSKAAVASTVTSLNTQYVDNLGGVVGEAILTVVFVMMILVATKKGSSTTFVAIGFTLAAVHLVGLGFTGASVNPARSFGPALVGGEWADYWIYLVGPLVGAVVAWVLYKVIVTEDAVIVAEDAKPIDDVREMM